MKRLLALSRRPAGDGAGGDRWPFLHPAKTAARPLLAPAIRGSARRRTSPPTPSPAGRIVPLALAAPAGHAFDGLDPIVWVGVAGWCRVAGAHVGCVAGPRVLGVAGARAQYVAGRTRRGLGLLA